VVTDADSKQRRDEVATTQLIAHRGSRIVERSEVDAVEPVEGTDTWVPTPHGFVLETVETILMNAGFGIAKSRYALSKDDARFFGTLDLTSPISEGVSLAVGVRNSIDKTFPIGLVAGSRVFVCDNLAFNSDIYVSKKHTRFGKERFDEGISKALVALSHFKTLESRRIEHYRNFELTETQAAATLLHGFENGILSTQLLPIALEEWRNSKHEEFRPRTAWSLFNSLTEAAKARALNPQKFAAITMKMYGLIDSVCGFNVAV
jgi:hypothetical protein